MPIIPPPPQMPIYSPDLSLFDRERAIWVYGGYPQVSHVNAEYSLMAKCLAAGFDYIGAAAIWTIERNHANANQSNKQATHTA